jgi:hypothetical protein
MGEISDEEVNECVLFNYNINFFFWQGCESLFLVGTRARFQVMYVPFMGSHHSDFVVVDHGSLRLVTTEAPKSSHIFNIQLDQRDCRYHECPRNQRLPNSIADEALL